MRETLPKALAYMFGAEGGYSNRKTDAGGPTKYGVTQKTLSAWRGRPASIDDVRTLTLDEAEKIYVKNYWVQSGGDTLPVGLDYAAFDFGVNSGPMTAVRILQEVVGVTADGWIGAQTNAAIAAYGSPSNLVRAYCDARMAYLRGRKGPQGWKPNGRGWTIRVTGKDPMGKWAAQPGVIGNALALMADPPVRRRPSVLPIEPIPAAPPVMSTADAAIIDAMSAKAEPQPENPLTKPEVVAPAMGLFGTLISAATSGPLAYAVSACVVIAFGVGAWYAIRRIRSATP